MRAVYMPLLFGRFKPSSMVRAGSWIFNRESIDLFSFLLFVSYIGTFECLSWKSWVIWLAFRINCFVWSNFDSSALM